MAVTGGLRRNSPDRALPLDGPLGEYFSRKARQHNCYIVVGTHLLESAETGEISNAAFLVGRKGEVVGIYRKVHLVVSLENGTLEGGATFGKSVPVFDCDFGKVGIQICYDMDFDYGWRELRRQGAELIAWPSQSPQTARPAFRALENRFYIVSSEWRHNASIFEPTGRIAAQIREPDSVLVREIDLSYALLPYSRKLQNGAALRKAFGDKVGFTYYEDEDHGIFWSNDPKTSIGEMVRSLGLLEMEKEFAEVRKFYARKGVGAYQR